VTNSTAGDVFCASNKESESFANMVAFAISQPEDVNVNDILFRPTNQEY